MKWIIILSALALTACGTSSEVRKNYTQSTSDKFSYEVTNTGGMSAEGLTILKKQLDVSLSKAGRLALENEPGSRQVKVEITHYRMRHGATRAMLGIMAGRDKITSDVTIVDATGTVLGQIKIDSGNSTAWGTSHGLIEGHANEIAQFILGTKS